MHLHLVRPGDTLADVARRYRVTPELLASRNALPSSSLLLPDLALCIPSEPEGPGTDRFFTYRVQEGDTPRTLSEKWRLPATWLSFCNGWSEEGWQVGDILLVPHTETLMEMRSSAPKPELGLLTFEASPRPATYLGRRGLLADAGGRLRMPDDARGGMLLFELDGSPAILPDVAKAILQSDHAKTRLLDGLAQRLQEQGAKGLLFDWQSMRPATVPLYLEFVRETGRRLRPMGLRVGLHLPADSPCLHKRTQLAAAAAHLDHLFVSPPVPAVDAFPPAPLHGVEDVAREMAALSGDLPPEKCWLVQHPVGVLARRGDVPRRYSPRSALQMAFAEGAPLQRDPAHELAWFRYTSREGGGSVWFEDLWSLIRKAETIHKLRWQGLALWEMGAHLPEVWDYLHEYYHITEE